MKTRGITVALFLLCFCTAGYAQDEMPQASAEHAVLKQDVGTWKARVSMFAAETPDVSEGREVNRMLGDFWLVSEFKGSIMGMDFAGCGTMGYDPGSKKYVGSWIDSMTPTAMHTSGTWDAATRTMTVETMGKNPDGSDSKGKMVTVYSKDGNTRTMTMFGMMPGMDEMAKMMEIEYTRVKE